MQVKEELRRRLIILRDKIDESKRLEYSGIITEKLLNLKEFSEASEIFCYFSIKKEIFTEDIISRALRDNKRVALPVCTDGNMIFRYIGGFENRTDRSEYLEKGSFGVYEPKSCCKQAYPSEKTVCITPALCYNEDGYRIGYGKGFYDRFFENSSCIKIGLCYEDFIQDFKPSENDISVNIIITENKIRRIGGKGRQANRKEDQNG